MTIVEYKEAILHQLEKADDCEDVERIIDRSIERMRVKGLKAYIVTSYLHELQYDLERLSHKDFDSVHWCNIRCAVMYLKKISVNQRS